MNLIAFSYCMSYLTNNNKLLPVSMQKNKCFSVLMKLAYIAFNNYPCFTNLCDMARKIKYTFKKKDNLLHGKKED